MKIIKTELKDKYGIDLSEGLYRIKNNGNTYTINIVKDDSKGCILIGDSKGIGKIYNSKPAVKRLVERMKSSQQDEWEIEVI